jgi:hypothetical protein
MSLDESNWLESQEHGPSLRDRRIPGHVMLEHGIEEDKQLAHASGEGYLLGLASCHETRIEGWIGGLCLLATNALMQRAARMQERPPQTVRFPRRVPLSRLKGATPIRAAICLRSRVPNSGR